MLLKIKKRQQLHHEISIKCKQYNEKVISDTILCIWVHQSCFFIGILAESKTNFAIEVETGRDVLAFNA